MKNQGRQNYLIEALAPEDGSVYNICMQNLEVGTQFFSQKKGNIRIRS